MVLSHHQLLYHDKASSILGGGQLYQQDSVSVFCTEGSARLSAPRSVRAPVCVPVCLYLFAYLCLCVCTGRLRVVSKSEICEVRLEDGRCVAYYCSGDDTSLHHSVGVPLWMRLRQQWGLASLCQIQDLKPTFRSQSPVSLQSVSSSRLTSLLLIY